MSEQQQTPSTTTTQGTDDASVAAAFASGFKEVRNEASPSAPASSEPAEKTQESSTSKPEGEGAATATPTTEDKPAADPWEGVHPTVKQEMEALRTALASVAKVPDRLRNIEGHIGGLTAANKEIKAALETARTVVEAKGATAPTTAQVQHAAKNPALWAQLKEDFPTWAEAIEPELAELRSAIAAIPKQQPVDTAAIEKAVEQRFNERLTKATADAVAQARTLAPIDLKHPGWETTVKSEAWKAWRAKQAPDVSALGSSSNPADSIKLLDLYSDHVKREAKRVAEKTEREKRLDRATPPDGVVVTTHQPSVEEAFASGFNEVRKPPGG